MVRMIGLFCVALSLLATEVSAREVTAADRNAISAKVDVLGRYMASGDFAGALDFVPPRLLQTMATDFGVTEPQVREAVREAMQGLLQTVTFVSFEMDLESAEAYKTTNGARDYMMIPTKSVMDVSGGGRVIVVSQTLAMSDDGDWYLIRVSEAQQASLLRRVYPEFADVEFSSSTMERVD